MANRITFLGVSVDRLTMQETIDLIEAAIIEKRFIHHVVINAAKVVHARNDQLLRESIVDCDIINADGQAIVWASRLLNNPLPERVAGIDLMVNLVALAANKGYKIFLLGAKDEVLNKVVGTYESIYGSDLIAGFRNGYFNKEEEDDLACKIAESNADMLFVAMSSPKKEIFLHKYKDVIKIPFIMGVGGSFDVIAGKTKRAPLWMQRAGLEWFFRVVQEPRRMWKRYLLGNSEFLFLVFKEKIFRLMKSVKQS